jgi:3-phenylpropionate/cinnamic acid dioxygenase small subunit
MKEAEMLVDTRITDRTEIIELFARLARLLDEGRYDDAHAIYTEDVVVRTPRGGELHGINEVTAFLRRSQVDGERTQHLHGDVLVNVDTDRAEASANQLVYFYRDGEPPHRTSGLRLAHTAVRTPAGWRFREAQLKLAWTHQS